jgi:hypothetical protein
MYGAARHIDQRSSFFSYPAERNGGVLIETKDRLVCQSEVCPASLPNLDPIARTIGVVKAGGL